MGNCLIVRDPSRKIIFCLFIFIFISSLFVIPPHLFCFFADFLFTLLTYCLFCGSLRSLLLKLKEVSFMLKFVQTQQEYKSFLSTQKHMLGYSSIKSHSESKKPAAPAAVWRHCSTSNRDCP